jgi:two-component system copper resistance phosphate regulon response regulator CusR
VDACSTGVEGLESALTSCYDLILLDAMLPDLDGFSLLRRLRGAQCRTAVLFVTARGDAADRIRGLDLGADDYLAKPFAFGELVARIRAIARRSLGEPIDGRFVVADLVVDTRLRCVERAGRRIEVTDRPFAILEVLIRSAGYVLSRSMILEKVWGPRFEALSNVIDVHIRALRHKIDDGFDPPLLHTVKGVGFVLEHRCAEGSVERAGEAEANHHGRARTLTTPSPDGTQGAHQPDRRRRQSESSEPEEGSP